MECSDFGHFVTKNSQNGRNLNVPSVITLDRIKIIQLYDINKMEDNFALRYVFRSPGIISRAELVPSHGASRRRLGDNSE